MAKKSGKSAAKSANAKKKKISAAATATAPLQATHGSWWSRLRSYERTEYTVKLPNSWRLTKATAVLLWQHKKLFGGITLVYGLLNLVLVQGLAGHTDVGTLKSQLDQAFTGHFGSLASSLSIFVTLLGASGNGSSNTAGAYQLSLALIASLAIIWALRQTIAGIELRIRDAYYRGMYPLVPFLLVLFVIGLQLIPLLLGSTIYNIVISNGIAASFLEKSLWALLYAVLALVTLYMLSASLFALYIITLPDMTPRKALRSARELVRSRRWTVFRKIVTLPIILLVAAAIIMVPIIILLTPVAQWVFFLLTMFALTSVHAYMYILYRELLNE